MFYLFFLLSYLFIFFLFLFGYINQYLAFCGKVLGLLFTFFIVLSFYFFDFFVFVLGYLNNKFIIKNIPTNYLLVVFLVYRLLIRHYVSFFYFSIFILFNNLISFAFKKLNVLLDYFSHCFFFFLKNSLFAFIFFILLFFSFYFFNFYLDFSDFIYFFNLFYNILYYLIYADYLDQIFSLFFDYDSFLETMKIKQFWLNYPGGYLNSIRVDNSILYIPLDGIGIIKSIYSWFFPKPTISFDPTREGASGLEHFWINKEFTPYFQAMYDECFQKDLMTADNCGCLVKEFFHRKKLSGPCFDPESYSEGFCSYGPFLKYNYLVKERNIFIPHHILYGRNYVSADIVMHISEGKSFNTLCQEVVDDVWDSFISDLKNSVEFPKATHPFIASGEGHDVFFKKKSILKVASKFSSEAIPTISSRIWGEVFIANKKAIALCYYYWVGDIEWGHWIGKWWNFPENPADFKVWNKYFLKFIKFFCKDFDDYQMSMLDVCLMDYSKGDSYYSPLRSILQRAYHTPKNNNIDVCSDSAPYYYQPKVKYASYIRTNIIENSKYSKLTYSEFTEVMASRREARFNELTRKESEVLDFVGKCQFFLKYYYKFKNPSFFLEFKPVVIILLFSSFFIFKFVIKNISIFLMLLYFFITIFLFLFFFDVWYFFHIS